MLTSDVKCILVTQCLLSVLCNFSKPFTLLTKNKLHIFSTWIVKFRYLKLWCYFTRVKAEVKNSYRYSEWAIPDVLSTISCQNCVHKMFPVFSSITICLFFCFVLLMDFCLCVFIIHNFRLFFQCTELLFCNLCICCVVVLFDDLINSNVQ